MGQERLPASPLTRDKSWTGSSPRIVAASMRVASLLLLVACDPGGPRDKAAPTTPMPTPVSGAEAADPSCTLSPLPKRYPQPRRVVAVGDLHGDIGGMRSALRAAGVIGDKD